MQKHVKVACRPHFVKFLVGLGNVPSNFSKSSCAYDFFCATLYQNDVYEICAKTVLEGEFMWSQDLLCALVSRLVRAHTRTAIEETLGLKSLTPQDTLLVYAYHFICNGRVLLLKKW